MLLVELSHLPKLHTKPCHVCLVSGLPHHSSTSPRLRLDLCGLDTNPLLSSLLFVSSPSSHTSLYLSHLLLLQHRVEATIQPQVGWFCPLGGLVTTKIPSAVSGWLNQNLDAPSKSLLTGGWHNSLILHIIKTLRARKRQNCGDSSESPSITSGKQRFTRPKVYGDSPRIW